MSKRLAVALLAAAAVALVPAGAAAVSPTIRLAIVHYVRGCHVWSTDVKTLGPSLTLRIKAGMKVQIRVSCPMDFVFAQTGGPRVALGDPRVHAGTLKTIVFPKRGVYRVRAKNVQSSAEVGLQTLGPDNTLTLTVIVS
jgi:hypothetical protein